MFIGIDPGASGAIAVLDAKGYLLDHAPMPTFKDGKSTRVNAAALAGFLAEYDAAKTAFVERVGAMGKDGVRQGASSMFAFGHSAGVVEGVLAALHIPAVLITPQAWKKGAGLIGKDKDAARTIAARLYPFNRTLDLKGKGQALADAILIARIGAGLGVLNGD